MSLFMQLSQLYVLYVYIYVLDSLGLVMLVCPPLDRDLLM